MSAWKMDDFRNTNKELFLLSPKICSNYIALFNNLVQFQTLDGISRDFSSFISLLATLHYVDSAAAMHRDH